MKLSIVILSYNREQLLIDCVDSILQNYQDEISSKKLEIIIVDNASEQKIIDSITKKLANKKGVKIIKNKENLGFGKGCNQGAREAKGDFVLFLNSDTFVESKGFFEMADFIGDNPRIAIAGGKLFNSDGTPQKSTGKFYNLLNFYIMLLGGERFGLLRSSPNTNKIVDWVSGACLMVEKKVFDQIGGFDENIFMYAEDMELSYRAKKKGYDTYFFADVRVKHKEHGSSNKTFAVVNIYKGLTYFYKIHKPKPQYIIVKISLLTKAMIIYLLGRITNNSYYIKTYGEAFSAIK